jgi:pentatricopeptide repeat domain-containing protein 1
MVCCHRTTLAVLATLASVSAFSAPQQGPADARKLTKQLIGHANARKWRSALDTLRSHPLPQTIDYNAAINACNRAGQWKPAIQLLQELTSDSDATPEADTYSFATTISALSSAPASVGWTTALRLLDEMEALGLPPSTVAYNAALRLLGKAGRWQSALAMLRQMQSVGDAGANGEVGASEDVADTISYNAVISAMKSRGQWQQAVELLSELEAHARLEADVVSYSAAIAACASAGRSDVACRLLARMRSRGVKPNEFSYGAAIAACEATGDWARAVQLLGEMEQSGCPPSVIAYTSAISACAKDGAWRRALRLLLRMPIVGCSPNAISYNAAISACARAGEWRAALALLRRMRRSGAQQADAVARGGGKGKQLRSSKGRRRASGAGAVGPGRSGGRAGRGGAAGRRAGGAAVPSPTIVSYNSAMAACARGGAWESALSLLDVMREDGLSPDAISYNTVLDALARKAQWRASLQILEQMRSHGVPPGAIALSMAASACEEAGEWDASLALLEPYLSHEGDESDANSRGDVRGSGGGVGGGARREPRAVASAPSSPPTSTLNPRELAPAFASAVRVTARAGELRCALQTLKAAERALGGSRKLHASAYAALDEAAARWTAARGRTGDGGDGGDGGGGGGGGDGGGRLHHDKEALLAEIADAVRSAAPREQARVKPRASFVLEGALAQCGHGENASSPSDIFLTIGSDGEVGGTVDVAREARALVWGLQRSSTYRPVLSALPARQTNGRGWRLSGARRRRLLSLHAEKKALAAQLALGYEELSVKLDHRMCADCHALFKAASEVYGRTIVATDSRVRHVFEAGRCSCRDAAYVHAPEQTAAAHEDEPAATPAGSAATAADNNML